VTILGGCFDESGSKQERNYGESVVKCHLIYTFYFLKLRLLSGRLRVQYIPVIVIGI